MTTVTNVRQVKANVMTKQQWRDAAKEPTEFYILTDDNTSQVAVDDKTIVKDDDDIITAIGTANKNTAEGATETVYDWIGTAQEYADQDIATLHPEWVCMITDDSTLGDDVYSKSETDALIAAAIATAVPAAVAASIGTRLNDMWPVGSVFLTFNNSETCPMADIIPGSAWTLVSSGKALWTGNGTNGNTTLQPGLPNITGTVGDTTDTSNASVDLATSGAFYDEPTAHNNGYYPDYWTPAKTLKFDASRSSVIYGASSTVQPPAVVVNVWKRIL